MSQKGQTSYSLAGLTTLLVFAMGMPMMIFYAIGILGPYLINDLKISYQQLGWLTASTFGLAAFLSPWAGALVQQVGTRNSLIGIFLLVGLSFSLTAVLPGFTGLVAALLFCGIAQAIANPATNQAIAESIPPSRKSVIVGLKQSGVQASALMAGLLLPSMTSALSWRGSLAIWAPYSLLMALLVTQWVPAKPTHTRANYSFQVCTPNLRLTILTSIQFCTGLVLSSFITFFGLYANQLGASATQIGTMISSFGLMGIISRVILTPIGNKLKDETVLLGNLFFLAGLALMIMRQANEQRHWPLWVGVLGMGLTLVATNAIAMSMLLRDREFGTAAESAGILSAGFFLGFAISPPTFGCLLANTDGFEVTLLGLISILAVGGSLCLLLVSMRRKALNFMKKEDLYLLSIHAIFQRMDEILEQCNDYFPLFRLRTDSTWKLSRRGSWLGGFWAGLWWRRAVCTYNVNDYARAGILSSRLQLMLNESSINRSFIFWYGTAIGHQGFHGDENELMLARQAANAIAADFQTSLDVWPLGTGMGVGESGARTIDVDALAPTLALLHQYGGSSGVDLANKHLQTCLNYLATEHGAWRGKVVMNVDGSISQEKSGIWPRGQAWAMLGMAEACRLYGTRYRKIALLTCDYWKTNFGKIHCDAEAMRLSKHEDLSAQVISAVAMLNLFQYFPDQHWLFQQAQTQLAVQLEESEVIEHGQFIGHLYRISPSEEQLVESVCSTFFLLEALLIATKTDLRIQPRSAQLKPEPTY